MGFRETGATYVIEQFWPGVNLGLASAQANHIANGALSRAKAGRTRILGATLLPDDETLFSWCASPSTEIVREPLAATDIRFDCHCREPRSIRQTARYLGSSNGAERPSAERYDWRFE